ncbi:hypothetical protein CYMTET_33889, partial [Cymbomonas tetramitiformis]
MIKFGNFTANGSRYGDLNQDWIYTSVISDTWVGLVLDGHGLMGERAARVAGLEMVSFLTNNLGACTSTAEMRRLLSDAFAAGHTACLKIYDTLQPRGGTYKYPGEGSPHVDEYQICKQRGQFVAKDAEGDPQPLEFGATATIALLRGDDLFVAWAGDSSAVLLFEPDDSSTGKHHTAQLLTVPHNGNNPLERERILRHYTPHTEVMEDGYI